MKVKLEFCYKHNVWNPEANTNLLMHTLPKGMKCELKGPGFREIQVSPSSWKEELLKSFLLSASSLVWALGSWADKTRVIHTHRRMSASLGVTVPGSLLWSCLFWVFTCGWNLACVEEGKHYNICSWFFSLEVIKWTETNSGLYFTFLANEQICRFAPNRCAC